MKALRKILTVVLAMVVCINFVACDKEEEINVSKLIGTWEITEEEGYEIEDGERDEWFDDYPDRMRIEFLEEGEYNEYTYYYSGWKPAMPKPGRYKLNGNKLKICAYDDYYDDEMTCITYQVSSLNEDQLVLEYSEKDVDYKYYEKITYRKVIK